MKDSTIAQYNTSFLKHNNGMQSFEQMIIINTLKTLPL